MDNKPEIHMPSPSYWPIVLAFSMFLIAVGVIFSFFISVAGLVLLLVAIAGWAMENRRPREEEHHG